MMRLTKNTTFEGVVDQVAIKLRQWQEEPVAHGDRKDMRFWFYEKTEFRKDAGT